MKNISGLVKAILVLVVLSGFGFTTQTAFAQLEEPEVQEMDKPRTPFGEGFHNSIGGDIFLNNFGFGIGGSYSRILGPYTQFVFRTGITGIRDASEQNFQSFLTGEQIIPNKYKRAFGFPFLFGLKQRIFAEKIADNMRLFISGSVGPAMAFTYPYVQDNDNSGFRTFEIIGQGGQQFLVPTERVNDFFSGWKNGETHWGLDGELKIGVDLGSKFKTKTTIEFGYFFYYFKEGLQIMEPYRPTSYADNGQWATREKFYDSQQYFGTPEITFTFGAMW